MSYGT